jgi:beta-galactosidase
MKFFASVLLFVAFASSTLAATVPPGPARAIVDFNPGWKFLQADAPRAEEAAFDDSAWRDVTVPHDWSIVGPVDPKNPSGPGGGFFPTGIVWYRKSFSLPAQDAQRRAYVAFDGVMANSDVWINGFHLGHRPNGSVSFYYELTGHLRFGHSARNVIAVRCDTSKQPASRWYEGGGIYRPVRLVLLQNLHLEPWSTVVTTPTVSARQATVRTQSTVVNESSLPQNVALRITLTAPDGRPSGSILTPVQTLAPGAKADFAAEIPVTAPRLWDIDHPSLYRVQVSLETRSDLSKSATVTDNEAISIGIREFHFDAATGFWLNGKNFKLKGVAIHADGGALGIAVPVALWESRLTALRALGVNAIRATHNPPSPEFFDLCDRMGFLVMEEMFDSWTVGKTPYDYHLDFQQWAETDARDIVRRDRNHPSIILWSAGNEIHDTPHAELAHGILARLIAVFHANDSTRPVTQALFRPNVSHDYDNGLADMLDVVGQNYRVDEILAAHAQKPSRKILGTENIHDRASWLALRDHAPYSGQFLWSGIDYLGEAGKWPMIGQPFGLLDRTGQPRPRAWERQSWWAEDPNVHIVRRVAPTERAAIDPGYESVQPSIQEPLLLDWTPRNTAPHTESVEVYTNCEEVALFLNGKSLGTQKLHPDASPLHWDVPYTPGVLKAVAYNQGKPVAGDELRTAGKAVRLLLSTKRATLSPGDDVLTITATAVDSNGIRVPDASQEVHFSITGPGSILATDNGSNTDHEPFQLPQHRLDAGRLTVFVQAKDSSGSFRVHATALGVADGETRITLERRKIPGLVRAF